MCSLELYSRVNEALSRLLVDNTETETVWSIGTTNTSMDEDNPPLILTDPTIPEEEETPPMLSNRTETINSTTQFFSLTEVQPQNTERYSGVSITVAEEEQISLPETRSGVKRLHDGSLNLSSSCIDQSKVVIVPVPSEHHQAYCDAIPLGGSAENIARIEPLQDPIASISLPSPTCTIQSFKNYAGPYSFDANFTKLNESSKNRHWDYSSLLSKLYIDMNKSVQVEFNVGSSPPCGLSIRALPVYSDANYINEPVRRCPNHASDTDPSNENFLSHRQHLIRVVGEDVRYLEDPASNRLSVAFPVVAPAAGSELISKQIKFMCLGSDVGGINRRPTKVVFTLEDNEANVLGRKVFDVRLCSCPRRDKQQEEERHLKQEDQARNIANK